MILAIIVIVGIKTAPWLFEHAKNPEYIRQYLAGFGHYGFLVYILIQAIQVIIVIIPGDIVVVCAGFVYGIPLGFVLSYFGLMLGSVIVFYISRFFGYEIVSMLIAEEKIRKISRVLNSSKGTVGLFVLCCIPFIPKDIMMYVAGLTPVKVSRIFLAYGLSRIPTTLIWVSIGANAYEKNIWGIGITLAVLLLLLILIFFLGRNYYKI
ncbi:MAG: VTT domain-containing protein [Bacteroidota bacterium]|nr:VTT domain-containing protein [Bacteroidota bacterium]